jgi:hypothetical protein
MRSFLLALVALLAAVSPAKAMSEEQLLDVYSHAYDASGKLSKADFKQIARFELLAADWNSELAPMVRGMRDPNMEPSEWARSSRRILDHVVQIKLKMTIAASQVEDTSARSLIRQIADINGKMLFVWEDIRQAFMDGDNEALRRAGMKAQGLAQEKITVAGPILRRLREKVGDKAVDGAMERELREVARKAGL